MAAPPLPEIFPAPLGQVSVDGNGGAFFSETLHAIVSGPGIGNFSEYFADAGSENSVVLTGQGVVFLSILAHESAHWLQHAVTSIDALFRVIRNKSLALVYETFDQTAASCAELGGRPLLYLREGCIPERNLNGMSLSSRAAATTWLRLLFQKSLDDSGQLLIRNADKIVPLVRSLANSEDRSIAIMANFLHLHITESERIRHEVDHEFFVSHGLSGINLRESYALIQQIFAPASVAAYNGEIGTVGPLYERLHLAINDFAGAAMRLYLMGGGQENAVKSGDAPRRLQTLAVVIDGALNPSVGEIERCITATKQDFFEYWLRFHPYPRFTALLDAVRKKIGPIDDNSLASGNIRAYQDALCQEAELEILRPRSVQAIGKIFTDTKFASKYVKILDPVTKYFSRIEKARNLLSRDRPMSVIVPTSAFPKLDAAAEKAHTLLRLPPFLVLADENGRLFGQLPVFNVGCSPFRTTELLKSLMKLYVLDRRSVGCDPSSLEGFHSGPACEALLQQAISDLPGGVFA